MNAQPVEAVMHTNAGLETQLAASSAAAAHPVIKLITCTNDRRVNTKLDSNLTRL